MGVCNVCTVNDRIQNNQNQNWADYQTQRSFIVGHKLLILRNTELPIAHLNAVYVHFKRFWISNLQISVIRTSRDRTKGTCSKSELCSSVFGQSL